MTPEQQNIAIAKAVGWKWNYGDESKMTEGLRYWSLGEWKFPQNAKTFEELPKYTTDLNAMHEACEVAFGNSDAWISFVDHLCNITHAIDCSMHDALVITNRATAAQRAEAFLRTLGLWEDEE